MSIVAGRARSVGLDVVPGHRVAGSQHVERERQASRRGEAYPIRWVGAHATPGPLAGPVKEADMWVSWVATRQVVVGGLLVVLAWVVLEVANFLLAALLLD